MTVEVKPLAEITHEALSVLCQHLGIANTMRFISQFTTGYGNYTEERRKNFADMSVDDIVAEIEKDRKQS
jgi:hypothetical protein